MEETFYFNEISNIETQTFDNSLENFYRSGVEGLVRENIQNSLDACLDNTKPVRIQIDLSKMNKASLPDIRNIKRHIDSLVGGNDYTQDTIKHMQESLQESTINVLTFEDSNTKGLAGADKIGEDTTYNIFAYKKGVHYKESDTNWENIRGGSHGVGKIANNAASDIHLMYFANSDGFGQCHLGGTIQLIEHRLNGCGYRSTGYFSAINESKQYVPYLNNYFSDTFRKDTQGLKLIIPFLKESYNEIGGIVRAVVDNFFVALFEGKLEVSICNADTKIKINKNTIQEISENESYYPENLTNIALIKKNFTPLYVDTYLSKADEPVTLQLNSKLDSYSFTLYFQYDENIKTGRVAVFRSIGMKISDYKVKNYVRSPFNAVLIGGPKEDEFLKTLENESHTEISSGGLRDPGAKRNANKFLTNLNTEIAKFIEEKMESLHPSDGKIDTSDLLYESEIDFTKNLSKGSQKIELADGEIIKKKVKEKRKPRSKTYEKDKSSNNNSNVKRKPRKIKPNSDEQNVKEAILAPNDVVDRVVFDRFEILQFHLENLDEIPSNCYLNIGFRIVDGEGNEYDNEFDLTKAYYSVLDGSTNIGYRHDSSTIHTVMLKNGYVKLKLNKKSDISDFAKIIYRLEVIS